VVETPEVEVSVDFVDVADKNVSVTNTTNISVNCKSFEVSSPVEVLDLEKQNILVDTIT
jgi:hypothetical protein